MKWHHPLPNPLPLRGRGGWGAKSINSLVLIVGCGEGLEGLLENLMCADRATKPTKLLVFIPDMI